MLNVKIEKQPQPIKAIFKAGDFFMTDGGSARQIIERKGEFFILNPRTGNIVDSEVSFSAQQAAEKYVYHYGPIQKLGQAELTLKATNEIIKGGM